MIGGNIYKATIDTGDRELADNLAALERITRTSRYRGKDAQFEV